MSESILQSCRACGRYTLQHRCPACGGTTRTPHPARYSPQDRYGRYRRALLASSPVAPPSPPAPAED
ncbi:MAG: RNA-protein complex protein Nop10 [Thermoplasmata archaeon]